MAIDPSASSSLPTPAFVGSSTDLSRMQERSKDLLNPCEFYFREVRFGSKGAGFLSSSFVFLYYSVF
ncbi:hypothetical protein SLEP1_g32311 [Rubroshorea leprosula]|uniref:Uncharacterized protein n=1 Tax=Rubroshorea leprosula TaxID=152421 RepID=A0AAV5KCV8_9ROSI|nr:hypothetical protein SLEP1_g32311 [Rubroshorea leprosula]